MSIIQNQSSNLSESWRTLPIDHLDVDSPVNFPLASLTPALSSPAAISLDSVRQLGQHIRQQLRGGDLAGALHAALQNPPYGADESVREEHSRTVLEVLGAIRASEIPTVLKSLMQAGGEEVDVLVKYLYKGMSTSTTSNLTSHLSPTATGGGRGAASSRLTPQSTGFSQIGAGRAGAVGDVGQGQGAAMSVLLSWHEKVIDVAGLGAVARCASDWRRV